MPNTKHQDTKNKVTKRSNKTDPDKKTGSELLEGDQDEASILKEIVALKKQFRLTSGPLPDPNILKEYNEILPDAAERIFKMAEKSQTHSHNMDEKLVDLEVKKVQKGQIFAFIIAMTGLIGAVTCAFLSQVTIGSIIGGVTVISLVSSFVRGKQKNKDSNEELKKLLENIDTPDSDE
jgi:uncharacterized membrane protein